GRRALQALASDDPVFGGVPAARQALARDALSDADTRRERQSAMLRGLPVFPAGAVSPPALLEAPPREGGGGPRESSTCLIGRRPARRAPVAVASRPARVPGGRGGAAGPAGGPRARGRCGPLRVQHLPHLAPAARGAGCRCLRAVVAPGEGCPWEWRLAHLAR